MGQPSVAWQNSQPLESCDLRAILTAGGAGSLRQKTMAEALAGVSLVKQGGEKVDAKSALQGKTVAFCASLTATDFQCRYYDFRQPVSPHPTLTIT